MRFRDIIDLVIHLGHCLKPMVELFGPGYKVIGMPIHYTPKTVFRDISLILMSPFVLMWVKLEERQKMGHVVDTSTPCFPLLFMK